MKRTFPFRGAHACSVLDSAFCGNELSSAFDLAGYRHLHQSCLKFVSVKYRNQHAECVRSLE